MPSRVYVRDGVRPSVCPTAANPLQQVRRCGPLRAGDIDRSLQGRRANAGSVFSVSVADP